VKTPFRTFHFALQQFAIEDVAGDAFKLQSLQTALVRVRSQQRLDTMPAREQFVHEIGADEAGRTGNKAFHKIPEPNLKVSAKIIPTNNSAAHLTCRARLEKIRPSYAS